MYAHMHVSSLLLLMQATKPTFSGRFNRAAVLLNVGFGVVYLCWRVFRSMNPKADWRNWAPVGTYFVDPDDPERAWSVLEELRWNWFSWLLFLAEIFLMLNIWIGHASRCFPAKRYARALALLRFALFCFACKPLLSACLPACSALPALLCSACLAPVRPPAKGVMRRPMRWGRGSALSSERSLLSQARIRSSVHSLFH